MIGRVLPGSGDTKTNVDADPRTGENVVFDNGAGAGEVGSASMTRSMTVTSSSVMLDVWDAGYMRGWVSVATGVEYWICLVEGARGVLDSSTLEAAEVLRDVNDESVDVESARVGLMGELSVSFSTCLVMG